MWWLKVALIFFVSHFSNGFNLTENLSFDLNTFLINSVKNINTDDLPTGFGSDIYNVLKTNGYPIETHWVKTEDDYVLRMHRIPAGRNVTVADDGSKPAVLLMHGLTGSSMHWVSLGPERSLALQLADQGFDVWLGNNRGNTWSRQHVTLDPDLDADATLFWNFSFEKCGQYDLPAKIDYIIEKTGQQKIFYVGHSQGTTQFFAMAALRPEYNDKIALFSALAPVAYVQHMASPIIRILETFETPLEKLLTNVHELLSFNPLTAKLTAYLCFNPKIQSICATTLFFLCGFDSPQLDRSDMVVFMSEAPNGMSKNMILHYAQNIKSGEFQRYDYGTDINWLHYNSDKPPKFDISAITAPVALYYSQNDFFASIQDVERLASELPNVVNMKLIDYPLFNHLDFIMAKDVNTLVYQDLIKDLQKIVADGGTTTPSPGGASTITINSVYVTLVFVLSMIYLQ